MTLWVQSVASQIFRAHSYQSVGMEDELGHGNPDGINVESHGRESELSPVRQIIWRRANKVTLCQIVHASEGQAYVGYLRTRFEVCFKQQMALVASVRCNSTSHHGLSSVKSKGMTGGCRP